MVGSEIHGLSFDENEIKRAILALDALQIGIPDGELQVTFLSKGEMCLVHNRFLHDINLTDVITFTGDKNMHFAGEICISPDYALESASEHAVTFSEELTLYIVHGCLHLSGLDDISENEIIKMRQSEKLCMDYLKSKNFIPKFSYKF